VLATIANWGFGSDVRMELNWNRWKWLYPIKKLNRTEPTVFWLVPLFHKLSAVAPIKDLSCDGITI
jgi:hypothetical protein